MGLQYSFSTESSSIVDHVLNKCRAALDVHDLFEEYDWIVEDNGVEDDSTSVSTTNISSSSAAAAARPHISGRTANYVPTVDAHNKRSRATSSQDDVEGATFILIFFVFL